VKPGLLREIADRLGVDFARPDLLEQALTHRSYANEAPAVDDVEHNERLEFLGDAVLSLIVSDMLMRTYPHASEGLLSRMRSALVCGEALAVHARSLELGAALRLGRGESQSGGSRKASLLADAFEAVLGAIYLDGGLAAARRLAEQCLADEVAAVADRLAAADPKSRLQEELQARGLEPPVYALVATSGPDHRLRFEVEVSRADQTIGRGRGSSKKLAEQRAAADALDRLAGDADGMREES
jgi:ribonuclease-3